MKANAVATRYATAFVDALREQNKLAEHESFLEFCDLVGNNQELSTFFANVVIQPDVKVKVIQELGAKLKLPVLVVNFLRLLAANRRIQLLADLKNAVRRRVDEVLNISEVQLICAAEPSVTEIKAFETNMSKVLGCQIRVKTSTDRDILGGAIAHVGSYVFDGSVRGQLARLRKALVKEN